MGPASLVAPVLGLVVGAVVGSLAPYPSGVVVMGAGFWLGVLLLLATCFAAVRASSKTVQRETWVGRYLLTCLAFIAPIAVAIGFRLSFKTCTGLNLLGLPWPPAAESSVAWTCLALVLASTAALVVGLVRPRLRSASVVMLVYSMVAVVPTFIFMFLSVYGDPGPACVPI